MCAWSGPHPVCDANEGRCKSSVQGSFGPLSTDDPLPGNLAQHLFHGLPFFRRHRIFRWATTSTLRGGGDSNIFRVNLLRFHDPDRPGQPSPGKRFSKVRIVAIPGICQHDAEVDVSSNPIELFECQGPLDLWHRIGRWDPSALHARWILSPFAWQKEPKGQGDGKFVFRERERHQALTVGDLANLARILASHPNRMGLPNLVRQVSSMINTARFPPSNVLAC